jgi:SWI2/SNF2 ATPase/Phage integrase, N-terminal SAM-like domain
MFSEVTAGLIKLVAKNHQYLGVNNAFEALRDRRENDGKLGVFWHTQGSGKSLSMVFFSQKVLRKLPGDWTIVIVTDRQELDDQIYIGGYLDRWPSDSLSDTVKATTFQRYEQITRLHLKPTLGRVKLKTMTPAHVRSLP